MNIQCNNPPWEYIPPCISNHPSTSPFLTFYTNSQKYHKKECALHTKTTKENKTIQALFQQT